MIFKLTGSREALDEGTLAQPPDVDTPDQRGANRVVVRLKVVHAVVGALPI